MLLQIWSILAALHLVIYVRLLSTYATIFTASKPFILNDSVPGSFSHRYQKR